MIVVGIATGSVDVVVNRSDVGEFSLRNAVALFGERSTL
jgi:hypothetical protein